MAGSERERRFRKGLAVLAAGKAAEAAEHFHAAIQLERQAGSVRPSMRYLSYYGLSMAVADRPTHEAIRACEEAAERDGFDPVLQLNLARVYLVAGRTSRALATVERGLRVDATHPGLRSLLARLDRRARPTIPGLGRNHPVNFWLGRLRSRLTPRRRQRADSAPPADIATG